MMIDLRFKILFITFFSLVCLLLGGCEDDYDDVVYGCTVEGACNYDPEATCNTTCEYTSCAGCTDENACNYRHQATIDDGSCEYISCAGCTDEGACNYDSGATIDNGSCEYTTCAGCTEINASNYNPLATIDDGSCIYLCTKVGVIDHLRVFRLPANNVNVRLEIKVDDVLVLRTNEKLFITDNPIYFEQSDIDYNANGAVFTMNFPLEDGVMNVALFANNELVDSYDYLTCNIRGHFYIQGNVLLNPYAASGPGSTNGGGISNAYIAFSTIQEW